MLRVMNEENPRLKCDEKIAYETAEEAQAAIAANSYYYQKPKLSVYRCVDCGQFHVTRRHDES